jgi:hypothetical protein
MKTEIKSKEPQIDVQDETELLIEAFHTLNLDELDEFDVLVFH